APVIIADKYSMLSKEDSMQYNIGGINDAMKGTELEAANEANELKTMSKKERKKQRRAERKARKAERKAAKRAKKAGEKVDEQSTKNDRKARKAERKAAKKAKKDAKKAIKDAVKQAVKDCRATCETIEDKKARKACKKRCRTEEGYAPYYRTPEVEAVEGIGEAPKGDVTTVEDTIKEMDEEQGSYQNKLDSLEQVMKQEQVARDEKIKAAATNPTSQQQPAAIAQPQSTVPQQVQPQAPVVVPQTQPTIVMPPAPAPAPTPIPVSINNGVDESDVRSMLNERDLQDLKMQMEIMKLKQELQQGGKNDATLEMYKLETDRLRQEASDNKILKEIESLKKEIESLRGGSIDRTIEKEIIIEKKNDDEQEIIFERESSETDELNNELEELKKRLNEKKSEEENEETETETIDPNEDLRNEIERLKKQLEEKEKNEGNERSEVDDLRKEVEALRAEVKKKNNEKPANSSGLSVPSPNDELVLEIERLKKELAEAKSKPQPKAYPTTPVVNDAVSRKLDALTNQISGLQSEVTRLRNQPPPAPRIITTPAPPAPVYTSPAPRRIISTTPAPVYTSPAPVYSEPVTSGRTATIVRSTDGYEEVVKYFKAEIFFGNNSVYITPSEEEKIYKVISVLSDYPESRLKIEGHTDKTGAAEYNMILSRRRAEAIRSKLINEYGIDNDRLMISFYGEELANRTGKDPLARKVVLSFVR
ncbi:OmpA family protein, partial [Bernardetia sp.]|uniref:OmpA family protein n=1 Tax=Bernardetia sp. TaxID=1937974 RepID=UPI0025BE9914